MEYATFPLRKTWITQGMNGSYSHQGTKAIDFGWLSKYSSETSLYAPFNGKIVALYPSVNDSHMIALESLEKVKWADGTEDYVTIVTMHDNDISSLYIGKTFKQGQKYSKMGTACRFEVGKHCHMEVAKGKYAGMFHNSQGVWMVKNAVEPYRVLALTNDTLLDNDGYTYSWRKLSDIMIQIVGSPVSRNDKVNQIQVTIDNLRARKSANGEVIGYIKKGYYNYISTKKDGSYTWYEVEKNMWVAYSTEWAKILSKTSLSVDETNKADEVVVRDEKSEIKALNEQIQALQKRVSLLEQENESLKKEQPKLIFNCPKAKYYKICLKKNDKLYLKS